MAEETAGEILLRCYQALLGAYGPQGWWPGGGPFEVMVGAVLTQNTAWGNVERALENLKAAGVFSPAGLYSLPQEELERLLRPAGTYRVKAARLRALLEYLFHRHGGDPTALSRGNWTTLREELLAVPGIGCETADSILLYAAGRPTFVVDAYTRRLLGRLGLLPAPPSYENIRALFMAHLPPDPNLYGEYHALIVRHGKERCRKARPRCPGCPLAFCCPGESVDRPQPPTHTLPRVHNGPAHPIQ